MLLQPPYTTLQPRDLLGSGGCISWRNNAYISVVIALLKVLYADRSSKDRISFKDVILICPYKE
ncbi:hypothetical protein N7491_009644 [Penicillium cf. griseofulvum]|uniref:Uncharacterized protein n=1 Tax=Penicillium cf. griseofulvum TaxID=2972120 RepID=A0A9W9JP87_9EURO|nr:hypothetical protein N7472_004761 [Penicillium cf. griseofulvum]KAJ5424428.1 hypothetical protein N7491_009644 [Penicillium cf. griseofulvum]KAJ5442330.1 hypothetical protein N7445_005337 [Penicillium cf. griseofulvum]